MVIRPRHGTVLLMITFAVIGLNLRPFMTTISPLSAVIERETGLSHQALSLLTLVPVMMMGAVAFLAVPLQAAIGARRAVILAVCGICAGCALRAVTTGGAALIATAAIIGLGVAIAQSVVPGIIKREFPQRVGQVTGLYSGMIMGGGALGALASPRLYAASDSWTAALAVFALPALLALVLAVLFLPGEGRVRRAAPRATGLMSCPRTWLLMLAFGLVNGGYSSVVAWLAPFLQTQGQSVARSGEMLAMLALGQAGSGLFLSLLARHHRDKRIWLLACLLLQAIGFGALALAAAAAPALWVTVLGVGLGGCFSLTLIVALDHLDDPGQAGALSALMQGGGFAIAAIAPWLVAALHDWTGGYVAGWTWHLLNVGFVALLVLRLAPEGYAKAMGVSGGPVNDIRIMNDSHQNI